MATADTHEAEVRDAQRHATEHKGALTVTTPRGEELNEGKGRLKGGSDRKVDCRLRYARP